MKNNMKGYKLPFTDKFGNELHEGDSFKYTAHKGYLLPTFEGEIVWIQNKLAFGYEFISVENKLVTKPFAIHDELYLDFLRHIERIEK
jgi:hypothetical protein